MYIFYAALILRLLPLLALPSKRRMQSHRHLLQQQTSLGKSNYDNFYINALQHDSPSHD
jgi:hypothetical protein